MMIKKLEKGFTLVELIMVVGLVMILLSFGWINLTSLPSKASLQTDLTTLINDIKSQQMLSMTGDTAGGEVSDYGIYFENASYTLFKGGTYDPNDPNNFKIILSNDNLSFTGVSFPGNIILFKKGSGETVPGELSISDALSGNTRVVKLNKYGATTE